MAPSKGAKNFSTLKAAILNITTLIRALQTPQTHRADPIPSPPNPLAVLSDASKILKAQTTKLSLLMLNKPFTPSEIAHILNVLSNSCLPALATVLGLCNSQYTEFLRHYIQTGLSSIWAELLELVGSIPQDAGGVEMLQKEGTLLSTGVLWATCDKLIRVGTDGMVAVAHDAVKDSQALLQDAIDELDEWDPEEDSENSEDSEDEVGEDPKPVVNTPTTSDEEALAGSVQNMSMNPAITLKARALKHLRLVRLLYPALNKWRIKTFPDMSGLTPESELPQPSPSGQGEANEKHTRPIWTFNEITSNTQYFSEEADEIAGALYAGDVEVVEKRLGSLMLRAVSTVIVSGEGYNGETDGFSEWGKMWVERAKELRQHAVADEIAQAYVANQWKKDTANR